MVIDGHKLTDHCQESLPKPAGLDYFPYDFDVPAGYSLANYRKDVHGWNDCYRDAGLDYLKSLGYSVIQAI